MGMARKHENSRDFIHTHHLFNYIFDSVTRPLSRASMDEWYGRISNECTNGLPPYRNVFNVDSALFKTEIRVVYESEEHCSSAIKRISR